MVNNKTEKENFEEACSYFLRSKVEVNLCCLHSRNDKPLRLLVNYDHHANVMKNIIKHIICSRKTKSSSRQSEFKFGGLELDFILRH